MWLVFGTAAILFLGVGVGLTLAGVEGMAYLIGLGLGSGVGALYYRRKSQKAAREKAAHDQIATAVAHE